MEKICGFYASNVHLITMILPYLKKQLKKDVKIETFFEQNLSNNINAFLNNLIIDENEKKILLNINWKSNKIKKYNIIEKNLKEIIKKNNCIICLISGNKKYIKYINEMLNKFFKNYQNINIKIINLYMVTQFDDDIKKILDEHEFVFNTSGIHKIEEIFVDYKKEIAN